MMDAFIALPYLIYSLGRKGWVFLFFIFGCGGGELEQFKECVANEEGPSFQKTQIGWRKIVQLFKKKT